MNCLDIYKQANKLINTYETNDPFKIAEYLGINVMYQDLKNIKGIYTTVLKNKYIVINSKLDDIGRKTVCIHELGHNQLHKGLGINMFQDETCISLKTTIHEIEANFFTAEVQITDKRFLELAAENFTYSQIAAALNTYPELAMIKAQSLNNRGHKLNLSYIPPANFLSKIKKFYDITAS